MNLCVLMHVMLLLVLTTAVQGEDEFLDPEIAFDFSARMISADAFEVRYRIAEGYYMYRDRYRFNLQPDSVSLGAPQFPSGLWHADEFFGRSEVYRNEVTIRLPIVSGLQSRQSIRLIAVSQGCADAGVCYLPATQIADFESLGLPGSFGVEQ